MREPPLTLGFDDEPRTRRRRPSRPKIDRRPRTSVGRHAGLRRADGRRRPRQPGSRVRRRPAVARSLPTPATRTERRTPRSPTTWASNNVAEYTAVVRAIGLGLELGARRLELLLDSKLIVEQLAGRWRVKDAKLRPLWAEALQGLRTLPDGWTAAHVPRAQNSLDAMCNEAIDRVSGRRAGLGRPPARYGA